MANRLTDTDIWEQDWYAELPPKYKLFWNYIKDKCDNSGVWRPNKIMAQILIGEKIDEKEFLNLVNLDKERIRILPSKRWFLKDYFQFQYGRVFAPKSQVHRGALRSLVSNGIHISEVLGSGCGKLVFVDFETLRKIAYEKDSNSLLKAF